MPILRLDDADLHYEVHGEGQPFLFCSATCTSGEIWKFYQVPEFSRDHRVITFDQRGTGKSPVRSKDFSTERLAADAAALLNHLDARSAIVLGHSNGGRVAQTLALDYPDLVDKLILASSGGSSAKRMNGISIDMCVDLAEK
ncbi:MAG TPA: alpha/beta hydrolase, partial [Beijerinckiaceae bacterium]|nr:alpha/beta hydrolase [Beijerinckiaceae bacterium]